MTQSERADVRAETLRLQQELSFVPEHDNEHRKRVEGAVEQGNQQLIKDNLTPTNNQQPRPSVTGQ